MTLKNLAAVAAMLALLAVAAFYALVPPPAVLEQNQAAGSSSAGADPTPLERIEEAEGRMNNAADRLGRAVEEGSASTAQEAVEEIEAEYLEAVEAWVNMPTSLRDTLNERIDGLERLRHAAHEVLRIRFGIELP